MPLPLEADRRAQEQRDGELSAVGRSSAASKIMRLCLGEARYALITEVG
jgi:hypothetical protein